MRFACFFGSNMALLIHNLFVIFSSPQTLSCSTGQSLQFHICWHWFLLLKNTRYLPVLNFTLLILAWFYNLSSLFWILDPTFGCSCTLSQSSVIHETCSLSSKLVVTILNNARPRTIFHLKHPPSLTLNYLTSFFFTFGSFCIYLMVASFRSYFLCLWESPVGQ